MDLHDVIDEPIITTTTKKSQTNPPIHELIFQLLNLLIPIIFIPIVIYKAWTAPPKQDENPPSPPNDEHNLHQTLDTARTIYVTVLQPIYAPLLWRVVLGLWVNRVARRRRQDHGNIDAVGDNIVDTTDTNTNTTWGPTLWLAFWASMVLQTLPRSISRIQTALFSPSSLSLSLRLAACIEVLGYVVVAWDVIRIWQVKHTQRDWFLVGWVPADILDEG